MESLKDISISDLLPHQPPMVLIEKIESFDLQKMQCTCSLVIKESSCFYVAGQGVPAYVGVEYMAQTVGVLSGLKQRNQGSAPIQLGFLLGFDLQELTCDEFALGTSLHISISHEWGEQNIMQVSGLIRNATTQDILATGYMNVFSPENPDLFLQEAIK